MSDSVRSVPGTPIIQKVAREINTVLNDPRDAIRYMAVLERKLQEREKEQEEVRGEPEKEEVLVVTRGDIESIMDREMVD